MNDQPTRTKTQIIIEVIFNILLIIIIGFISYFIFTHRASAAIRCPQALGYFCNGKIGDYNQDGKVNDIDFQIFQPLWVKGDLAADLNKDGKVSLSDLSIFASNYGK